MQGYALLCVGFPTSDLEVETQDEDEVTYYKIYSSENPSIAATILVFCHFILVT